MKSLKTIVIAGIVLVAVIIGIVVVTHLPAPADESAAATSASAASDSSGEQTIYIVNRDYDTLNRFTVLPTKREVDDDTAFAYASEEFDVSITRGTDDKGETTLTYDVDPDAGAFDYDVSLLRSMIYTVSSISAKSVVEEDAKDLSAYGLDDPTATVKTYYDDGSEVDIFIGSMTPVDGNYYCMTSESNTVYVLGAYVDSLLVRRPIDYRAITLFPPYEDDAIYENISWVRLTDRDGSVIEIMNDMEQDNEYNTEESQYVMLEPYQVSGNDTVIKSDILDVVATLTLNSIVCDIQKDAYAEYGLDDPKKLEMKDTSGNSVSLLVGDLCPNADYTYCMLEGTNTVLTCNSPAFACFGESYVSFMLRTAWTYSIVDVAETTIQVDGETYDMQLEHYVTKNANGDDTDGINATLNGEKISESNARRLYIKCLYFRIIDSIGDETYDDTVPAATITVTLLDGKRHTLKLYPMGDRKYAMDVDGTCEYYCYKKNLTSLTDSIGYVLAGDELDFGFE